MKVLLDTNVWRYLVDSESQDNLYRIAQRSKVKVTVCPGVVIETLRMEKSALRKKIIETLTRGCWERLMPDAFLECEDVRREMVRTHPEWELDAKDVTRYRRLRYDWVRSKGGFWSHVRDHTDDVAARYRMDNSSILDEARAQAHEIRSSIVTSGNKIMTSRSLKDVTGSWTTINGDRVVVDLWRFYAVQVWANTLKIMDSPFRQWMGCQLNVELILNHYIFDFVKFWEHEAQVESVPREWLRAAVWALQSERKVTNGNPMDSAIGVHLVDVDFVVSADKNFVSIVNQCHEQAPFRTANAFLIGAGKTGIDQLFQMISEKKFSSRYSLGTARRLTPSATSARPTSATVVGSGTIKVGDSSNAKTRCE
jgi:hypothetical protein